MRTYHSLLIALLVAAGLASCDRFQQEETEEAGGRDARIVCVSKQLNEIIFALGAGDRLVGVDLSSTYPPEAAKLPTVGYHRLLSAEGITSLNPTVVFHDGNIAPAAVMTQLEQVGVPVKEFPEAHTIDETKELIRMLGREFDAGARADSLCNTLDADMRRAEEERAQYTDRPKVVIIHFGRQMNIYLAVGQKNTATKMIEWAGGVNPIAATEGMKPISPEMIADAQPDVILATDFGYDKAGGLDNFKKLPGVSLTPAAQNDRIYRVEEHDLVYLGPRTGRNILDMMQLIHQQ